MFFFFCVLNNDNRDERRNADLENKICFFLACKQYVWFDVAEWVMKRVLFNNQVCLLQLCVK